MKLIIKSNTQRWSVDCPFSKEEMEDNELIEYFRIKMLNIYSDFGAVHSEFIFDNAMVEKNYKRINPEVEGCGS